MDGGGSIGQSEVPSPEGGGGVTGSQFSFLYKHELFQIVVYHIQVNKNGDKPLLRRVVSSFLYDHREVQSSLWWNNTAWSTRRISS